MNLEDDEIVEEIPVYLSKTLADNVFVLQYPTKKTDLDPSESTVLRTFVKPMNQEIKIEYNLDTTSRNYDAFKGEQLAIAADGKDGRNDRSTFNSGTMDRQSFISTKVMENSDRYIVGYMTNHQETGMKEIHMSLVKGMIQMRPSFSYFDKSDTRKKAEQKTELESDTEEEEAKQVTVKFARTETDRTRKAREKSFNYLAKKSADEPWCEAMWHDRNSVAADIERQKLFSTSNESTGHALSLPNGEYIEVLIPAERDYSNVDTMVLSNIVCMNKLRTMSLADQIQQILKDAKVVSFQRLTTIIDTQVYNEEKIFRTLPTVGLMIHGNWVVQSEALYPPNTVSATNGVPAELMCRARDYILYQFYRNELIDRKKISSVTQLPADEVKELLLTISKWDGKNCWVMLCPPNIQFEEMHTELKQRQDIFWRSKDELFTELEHEARSPRRKRKVSTKSESK